MTTDLSDAQRLDYEREGSLVLDGILGDDDLGRLRTASDLLVEQLVDLSLALGKTSARLDLQRRGDALVLRKVQPLADVSPAFAELTVDSRLTVPLAELLDSEPVLMEEKLTAKQRLPGPLDLNAGSDGESFPFHTDWAYYCLDGYPRQTLSVAVALDDATPESGCLRVVPRSHDRDWPLRGGWPPLIANGAVDESDVVEVPLAAGSALVFSSALVHASSENRTENPRRLLILSYHPTPLDIEPDIRNRHLRAAAGAEEERYRDLVAAGRWTASYRL